MSNRAWVTLATNDSYGLGALVLAHSLRQVNSAYPAVILVTPTVTEAMRNRLSAVFAEVIPVDVLDSRDATHLAMLQRPELGITFTKIHCWSLTQYEKCVFLDADTLVVQNCDELFEREELSAAPDVGWPDCFNSGVFVFVPSSDTYTRLIAFAQERGSFDGGDQGLLNAFFSDWAHGDINKHLPFLYNVTSAAFYSYLPALKHYGQNLKIIHFIGAMKPWLQRYNWESRSVDAPDHIRELLQQWWDIFVGQVHPNLDSTMEPTNTNVENSEEEEPPEVPPQDLQYHYEAKVDPQSEFPWHHPETQVTKQNKEEQTVDMSRFYDPWANYKFSATTDHSLQYENENISQFPKPIYQYHDNTEQSFEQHIQTIQTKENMHQNSHGQSQFFLSQNYFEHYGHTKTDYQYQEHQNINTKVDFHNHQKYQELSHIIKPQNEHDHYGHTRQTDYQYQQHHNEDTNVDFQDQQRYQEQSQYYLSQNKLHKHTSDYQYNRHNHSTHAQSDYQKLNQTIYHGSNDLQIHGQQKEEHNLNERNSAPQNGYSKENTYLQHPVYINRPRVEKLYYLHWDIKRRDRHPRRKMDRIKNITEEQLVTNGHISDTDSEYEDDFRPRHPYDGFYLRHRVTIDSRGRKVCTHEIPPTPLSSPPPEEDVPCTQAGSLAVLGEDEEYLTASECEDQSGVAGNLARVVPGIAASQSEAMDELTRRQGWEAGNIDYMGADSFTNIWAKISQTLNQPTPKQPSPPRKEASPPKQPSPPKEQPQPELPKELEVQEAAPVIESKAVASTPPAEITATVVAPLAPEAPQPSAPGQTEAAKPVEDAVKVESVPAVASVPEALKEKSVPTVPPTPPATPKSTPEASTPVTEVAPKLDVSSADQLPVSTELPKAVEVPQTSEEPQAVQAPKLAESPQAVETPKPSELPQQTETPIVAEVPQAAETPKPSEPPQQTETPIVAEVPQAAETLKPSEPPQQTETPIVAEVPQILASAAAPASTENSTPAATNESTVETTPVKLDSSVATTTSTDSPPLANTPSKDDAPTSPAAKSEERRKPVEKLQLSPPAAADPLPTPDSEAEDAATLAQSIIASELKVTSPSPSEEPKSPQLLQEDKKLNVQKPELPTPPVSLAQIGVKPKAKPTTAAQIESSVLGKTEAPAPAAPDTPTSPTTPTTPSEPSTPTETAAKKKVVKKVVKKEGGPGAEGGTPVPPPRKKEKKPKDK